MYEINPTPYGFHVTSGGCFDLEEVTRLRHDLLHAIHVRGGPFSLVIDSRTLVLPIHKVREMFFELHAEVWRSGCLRVAFIVLSPVAKYQVKQMHYTAAPGFNDRIIDASVVENWEEIAVAWAADGIDPEPAVTRITLQS